jgi:hypothetical protein
MNFHEWKDPPAATHSPATSGIALMTKSCAGAVTVSLEFQPCQFGRGRESILAVSSKGHWGVLQLREELSQHRHIFLEIRTFDISAEYFWRMKWYGIVNLHDTIAIRRHHLFFYSQRFSEPLKEFPTSTRNSKYRHVLIYFVLFLAQMNAYNGYSSDIARNTVRNIAATKESQCPASCGNHCRLSCNLSSIL